MTVVDVAKLLYYRSAQYAMEAISGAPALYFVSQGNEALHLSCSTWTFFALSACPFVEVFFRLQTVFLDISQLKIQCVCTVQQSLL